MKKMLSISFLAVSLFAANENTKNININVEMPKVSKIESIQHKVNGIIPNSPTLLRPAIIKVSGIGEGVPPVDTVSPAQAMILARRAAIADAYRSLAEKMYGIRLTAKDRIRDLMVQRTEVRTAVTGLIRGATIDEESWKNGIYKVVLVVNLDACRWSSYLPNISTYYQCNQ